MNVKYPKGACFITIYHWHKYTLKCSNFTKAIKICFPKPASFCFIIPENENHWRADENPDDLLEFQGIY